MLSAFVLAPDGRKVKCSACGETWFQLPDPEELREDFESKPDDIPASIRPVPRGSGLPVIKGEDDDGDQSSGMVGGAVAAALLFVLVTAVLVFQHDMVVRTWPPAHKLYDLVGIKATAPGDGLVFDKLEAHGSEQGISVSGTIINLTRGIVPVPVMHAELLDAHGAALASAFIEPPHNVVEAEASLPFTANIPDHDGAAQIHIRFSIKKP